MTEPKPQWPATEAEVLREVDERLRAAGWFVVVTSQDKSTRRQMAGLPDRIAFRNGVTLLIEGKSPRGQLRKAQRAFAEAVRPHLGPHLHYEVVRHPAQIELYCEEGVNEVPKNVIHKCNGIKQDHRCLVAGAEA